MTRSLLLVLCALLLIPVAQAQSAEEVLRAALARYEADLAGVDNYTVTRSVMGTESTTYSERTEDGGPLGYPTYLVLPTGLQETGDDSSLNSPYALLDRISESARYEGTQDVDGERAHVVVVDNFGEIVRNFEAIPEDADAEMEVEAVGMPSLQVVNWHNVPVGRSILLGYRRFGRELQVRLQKDAGLQFTDYTFRELRGMQDNMDCDPIVRPVAEFRYADSTEEFFRFQFLDSEKAVLLEIEARGCAETHPEQN